MTTIADISHHQGAVDLAAYARSGRDRIIIKATGGALDGTLRYVDPMFGTWWRQAGQLGLHRVAYHFARNNNTGGDELVWCLSQLQAAGGLRPGDVLCYDTEDDRPGMLGLARQRLAEFVAAAVRAGITSGWIYTGKWYADPAGLTAAAVPAPGWRQLWLSDYTPGQPDDQIELPAGWTRAQVVARQYTDAATFPGIPGACDGNRVLKEWITDMPLTNDDAATVWNYGVRNPTSGAVQSAAQRLLDANDDSAVKAVAADLAGLRTELTDRLGAIEGALAGIQTALAAAGQGDAAAQAAAIAPHLHLTADPAGGA